MKYKTLCASNILVVASALIVSGCDSKGEVEAIEQSASPFATVDSVPIKEVNVDSSDVIQMAQADSVFATEALPAAEDISAEQVPDIGAASQIAAPSEQDSDSHIANQIQVELMTQSGGISSQYVAAASSDSEYTVNNAEIIEVTIAEALVSEVVDAEALVSEVVDAEALVSEVVDAEALVSEVTRAEITAALAIGNSAVVSEEPHSQYIFVAVPDVESVNSRPKAPNLALAALAGEVPEDDNQDTVVTVSEDLNQVQEASDIEAIADLEKLESMESGSTELSATEAAGSEIVLVGGSESALQTTELEISDNDGPEAVTYAVNAQVAEDNEPAISAATPESEALDSELPSSTVAELGNDNGVESDASESGDIFAEEVDTVGLTDENIDVASAVIADVENGGKAETYTEIDDDAVSNEPVIVHEPVIDIDPVVTVEAANLIDQVDVQANDTASDSLLTFGNPVAAYGLANQTVGRASLNTSSIRRVAYGFVAKSDAYINTLRQYVIWSTARAGYHGGTGGTLRIEIVNDNNGVPGNTVISDGVFVPNVGATRGYFDSVSMSGGHLVVGEQYWIRYTQADAQPATNWVSVNAMNNGRTMSYSEDEQPGFVPHMIKTSDNGGAWDVSPHLGIYEIGYADGVFQGNGYISSHAFNSQHYIGGVNKVRQKFIPTQAMTLESVKLRVARISGAGELTSSIKNILGETIASSSSNQLSSSVPLEEQHWVSFSFAELVYLMEGEEYYLEVSASEGSTYFSYPSQSGNSYGFSLETLGFNGYDMELSTDNGDSWLGWAYDGRTNRRYQEMSMVLKYR